MLRNQSFYCAAAAALLVSATVAGCSDDSETAGPPEDVLLEPPPAGEGVQFRMVTKIEPGSEVEHCQFFKAPAEGLNVNRDEIRFTSGSHHVLLYLTPYDDIPTTNRFGEEIDTSGVFDCSEGPTGTWEVSNLLGGSQNSSGDPTLSFPPDVAMKVAPNAVVLMNAHYINPQAEALEPEVRINLFSIPDDQVKTEGGILFFYNALIRVDPMGEGLAKMSCPLPDDVTLGNAQSHMHRRGVGYSASVIAPDAAPELIYENDAWEGVPVKTWEAGLAVKAGSRIEYNCDYQNSEDRQVYQGPKSTDEMCMFIASYWPADNQVSVCATDPDDTYGTQALNANWVGNGEATCGETLTCIQNIEDQSRFLQGLTDCVLDSAPEESTWVSNGVRCLLTHADPVADCLPEIQACLEH
jgi:hypothetical protein